MRVKVNHISVNSVHEKTIVNFCDIFKVKNTQRGKKVMILGPGTPASLAERSWFSKYLAEFDSTIEDIVSLSCYQVF